MLALPMETIVAELPVRPEIQQALLGIPGKERVLLSWIECVEANRVSESQALAAAHSLDEHRLVSLYMESLLSDASDSVLN
jgi:c-di-GMP-related signal transduction protein